MYFTSIADFSNAFCIAVRTAIVWTDHYMNVLIQHELHDIPWIFVKMTMTYEMR